MNLLDTANTSEIQPLPSTDAETAPSKRMQWFLRWLPFGATSLQVVPCAFLLGLSGYRTVIGGLAVFSAAIAGPFELFHQNKVRIPFFVIAGGLSLLNLYLYAYAKRRRELPASQWRRQPLSTSERRIQKVQLYTSILTLVMIAGDIISHKMHGFGF